MPLDGNKQAKNVFFSFGFLYFYVSFDRSFLLTDCHKFIELKYTTCFYSKRIKTV